MSTHTKADHPQPGRPTIPAARPGPDTAHVDGDLNLVADHPSAAGEQALFQTITEITRVGIDSDTDTGAAAQTIIGLAGKVIDCDDAGLAVLDAGNRLQTFASTGPTHGQADRWQYDIGQGPCIEAATKRRAVVSNDITSDPRWPNWAPKAAALGLRIVLAVPLTVGDRNLGAMSLYATSPQAYTPTDRDRAAIFAAHATAALTCIHEREHLHTAINTRTQIGQAQGILMARYRLDAAQAFAVLRRYSQAANRKLRDLAIEIIATGDLPGAAESTGATPRQPASRPADRPSPPPAKNTECSTASTEVQVMPHSSGGWQVSHNGNLVGVYDQAAQAIQVALDRSRINRAAHLVIYGSRGQTTGPQDTNSRQPPRPSAPGRATSSWRMPA